MSDGHGQSSQTGPQLLRQLRQLFSVDSRRGKARHFWKHVGSKPRPCVQHPPETLHVSLFLAFFCSFSCYFLPFFLSGFLCSLLSLVLSLLSVFLSVFLPETNPSKPTKLWKITQKYVTKNTLRLITRRKQLRATKGKP